MTTQSDTDSAARSVTPLGAGTMSNRIRQLRFEHGEMTQSELGERIGVTRQTIAAIEAGKYSPSLESAFRIAKVFDVKLDEVFQYTIG